jgi:hypothetical protein
MLPLESEIDPNRRRVGRGGVTRLLTRVQRLSPELLVAFPASGDVPDGG